MVSFFSQHSCQGLEAKANYSRIKKSCKLSFLKKGQLLKEYILKPSVGFVESLAGFFQLHKNINRGKFESVCPEMDRIYPDLQLRAFSVQAVHSPTTDNNSITIIRD